MEAQKLFSVPETGRLLGGLSRWTLYGWLSRGRLKGVKIGSRVMVAESEIARLIAEGERQHTAKKTGV